MSVSPGSLSVIENGSVSVGVTLNNLAANDTITTSFSSNGQFQASPSSANVTPGSNSASFSISVKKQDGTVTFGSTRCGSKDVDIDVHN
jgi:hypothetical protein